VRSSCVCRCVLRGLDLAQPGESDGCTRLLPSGQMCPRFDQDCESIDSIRGRAPEAGRWFDMQARASPTPHAHDLHITYTRPGVSVTEASVADVSVAVVAALVEPQRPRLNPWRRCASSRGNPHCSSEWSARSIAHTGCRGRRHQALGPY